MPGKRTPEAAARRLQKKLKHDEDKKVREAGLDGRGMRGLFGDCEEWERVTMALEDTWTRSAEQREADWMVYAEKVCT